MHDVGVKRENGRQGNSRCKARRRGYSFFEDSITAAISARRVAELDALVHALFLHFESNRRFGKRVEESGSMVASWSVSWMENVSAAPSISRLRIKSIFRFELGLGWYGNYDGYDLAALTLLSHGPQVKSFSIARDLY